MNSQEIAEFFKKDKQFKGIFASDRIPKSLKSGGVIVNTDSSREPGEHWIAMFLDGNGCAEYFDPLGVPPIVPQIILWLSINSPNGCHYNCRPIQGLQSISCGLYCIAYLKFKFSGKSMVDFVSKFCMHTNHNENNLLRMILENIQSGDYKTLRQIVENVTNGPD